MIPSVRTPLPTLHEALVLAALAAAPAGLSAEELVEQLGAADVAPDDALAACEALYARGALDPRGGAFELASRGAHELLAFHAAVEHALDPSPTTPGMEECPSIPWLTTVQTHWLHAVSLNYAVDPDALRALLPEPLEPEVFHGKAWVQLLVSSLREMRPQGAPSLFGINFHQASYRAAVRYRSRSGAWRRGGYFVRSETDHAVMRAIGNTLVEFKFHDFGLADMRLDAGARSLALSIRAVDAPAHGDVDATFDLRRASDAPPKGSVWASKEELFEPLVECYDAFGVDPEGWVYVLTIDREPWRERFVAADVRRADYFERGALGGGASRLDSVLHVPVPCAYRWRPLRRERWRG